MRAIERCGGSGALDPGWLGSIMSRDALWAAGRAKAGHIRPPPPGLFAGLVRDQVKHYDLRGSSHLAEVIVLESATKLLWALLFLTVAQPAGAGANLEIGPSECPPDNDGGSGRDASFAAPVAAPANPFRGCLGAHEEPAPADAYRVVATTPRLRAAFVPDVCTDLGRAGQNAHRFNFAGGFYPVVRIQWVRPDGGLTTLAAESGLCDDGSGQAEGYDLAVEAPTTPGKTYQVSIRVQSTFVARPFVEDAAREIEDRDYTVTLTHA